MKDAILGVIGGSGLYDLPGLTLVDEHLLQTPFGKPSGKIIEASMPAGTKLFFLARHGEGHTLLPGEVNYRANIYALKSLGVSWLLSVSAVGSLKEEIAPGKLVLPDQFFDRTKGRMASFFGEGVVAHVPFGDPVCGILHGLLKTACESAAVDFQAGGTYICMEGPMFSTRAESMFYRSLGADIIGMTNLPEAKLAREAQMSYATLALSTDYDCWHEAEEAVSVEAVMKVMKENVSRAKAVLLELDKIFEGGVSPYRHLLEGCIVSDQSKLGKDKQDLLKLLGK